MGMNVPRSQAEAVIAAPRWDTLVLLHPSCLSIPRQRYNTALRHGTLLELSTQVAQEHMRSDGGEG